MQPSVSNAVSLSHVHYAAGHIMHWSTEALVFQRKIDLDSYLGLPCFVLSFFPCVLPAVMNIQKEDIYGC